MKDEHHELIDVGSPWWGLLAFGELHFQLIANPA